MAASQLSDQSEKEFKRELWSERNPSYTESKFVDETALLVDYDLERDVDEILAISEASAISALEALKA